MLPTQDIFQYLNRFQEEELTRAAQENRLPFEDLDRRLVQDEVAIATYVLHEPTRSLLYLEGDTQKLTGYSRQHLLGQPPAYLKSLVHPLDWVLMESKVLPYFQELLFTISDEELPNWRFSMDYRIRRADQQWMRLIQQYVIASRDSNGLPLLSCGTVTDCSLCRADDRISFTATHFHSSEIGQKQMVFQHTPDELISDREKEVLLLIAQGKMSKQIALELHISQHTVNNHRSSLLKKTGSGNTVELLKYALQHQLI